MLNKENEKLIRPRCTTIRQGKAWKAPALTCKPIAILWCDFQGRKQSKTLKVHPRLLQKMLKSFWTQRSCPGHPPEAVWEGHLTIGLALPAIFVPGKWEQHVSEESKFTADKLREVLLTVFRTLSVPQSPMGAHCCRSRDCSIGHATSSTFAEVLMKRKVTDDFKSRTLCSQTTHKFYACGGCFLGRRMVKFEDGWEDWGRVEMFWWYHCWRNKKRKKVPKLKDGEIREVG